MASAFTCRPIFLAYFTFLALPFAYSDAKLRNITSLGQCFQTVQLVLRTTLQIASKQFHNSVALQVFFEEEPHRSIWPQLSPLLWHTLAFLTPSDLWIYNLICFKERQSSYKWLIMTSAHLPWLCFHSKPEDELFWACFIYFNIFFHHLPFLMCYSHRQRQQFSSHYKKFVKWAGAMR